MTEQTSQTVAGAAAVVGPALGDRLLVIGDQAWADHVRAILENAGLEADVQAAPDCLMALGQVAAEPPSTILAGLDTLDEPLEATAQAFRRLAPDTLLLITTTSQDVMRARAVVDAGFDQWIMGPLDGVALGRALRGRRRLDALGAEAPWLIQQGPCPDEILKLGGVDPVEPSSEDQASSPTVAMTASGPFHFEADLIEHLLQGQNQASLRRVALEVIASQVGTGSVAWARRMDEVPTDHVRVPIDHGGKDLGVLHASGPVRIDQLLAWAPWLGRWLALADHVDHLRRLAMRDEMTGLWNRRYFDRFLKAVLERAADRRFHVSLLVFDIDDFKTYNDRYGHLAGDDILRETAKLMQSLVREHDVVARIGGDEFAVIFWDTAGPRRPNSTHPHDPIQVARRFQKAICAHRFPKLADQAPGTLTISGGLAGFPWDGRAPQELLDLADKMALRSKQHGKNAITIGAGAQRNCSEMSGHLL